jgi:HAD superfamily phosphoserine phosphatase-like hydrolase
MSEFDPRYPEDLFFVRDREDFIYKVGAIAVDGTDQLSFLYDCDRTLTRNGDHDALPTIWHAMRDALSDVPAEGEELSPREQDDALGEHYQALEFLGQLDEDGARLWWNESLGLHVKYRTNVNNVNRLAQDRITLRAGVIDLFNLHQEHDIVDAILSAGITEPIEALLAKYNLHPSLIVATDLETDPDGVITGWDQENMVHIHNKRERGDRRLAIVRQLRRNTILVGDSPEDAKMADDSDDGVVIRVRVSDLTEERSTSISPRYVADSFRAGYDAVIGNNLKPLVALSEFIIANSGVPVAKIPKQPGVTTRVVGPRTTAE